MEVNLRKRRSHMRSTTGLCAIVLTAAGLLFMPAANAEDQPPSAPQSTAPGPAAPRANIPDDKLDAVAAAVKGVSAISETYEQKLAEAPAAEKQRIAGEADNAITKAVTDQGLSIEEYMTIMKVAQNDPMVRDKLIQRLKK